MHVCARRLIFAFLAVSTLNEMTTERSPAPELSECCAFYRKSLRKRCRSWESPSLALRWSARFPRLLHAWFSSVHFSCRSSADSGWDWIRRSAVSPREFT